MSGTFDAFHPREATTGALETLRAGDLPCRWPEPTPERLTSLIERLLAAGDALRDRPVDHILRAIDAVARRLLDPTDPLRREAEALLPRATGYSPPMVRLILDRMAADWRAPALRRLLHSELGDDAVLRRFVAPPAHAPQPGPAATMAVPPRLVFQVFAGNVPGVAVTSLIRALLVRAPSFGKLAAGEPVLPVLFARALAEVDPAIGAAVVLTYWPGGSADPEALLLTAADVVVVYGGEAAVESLRPRVPAATRLVVHGPRLSLGAIGNGPLEGGLEGVATRAARAVATFDQQGCVSPHALWVEGPPERAHAFAAALAAALDRLADELPRGALTAGEASAVQQERGVAELRGHEDPNVRLWTGHGTSWTVLLEPHDRIRPSCLNRFIRVHPIPDLAGLPARLEPLRSHLQSVALEGAGDRDDTLARALAHAGATRITTFERLPWPPPDAHHDGSPPLRELLRWADRER